MTRTIKIIEGMSGFFDILNSYAPYHEKKNGVVVSSELPDKLVTIRCADGSCLGKNVGETLTVGTVAEVYAGTSEIIDDVADRFIELGFAEEV